MRELDIQHMEKRRLIYWAHEILKRDEQKNKQEEKEI